MENNKSNSINVEEIKPNFYSIKLDEYVQGGSNALDFSSTLFNLIEKNAVCVIIDLQNVKLMNSSGLGMLLNGLKTLKQNNTKMCLVNLTKKIIDLLEMTHLDKVFQTYKSIDDAINSN